MTHRTIFTNLVLFVKGVGGPLIQFVYYFNKIRFDVSSGPKIKIVKMILKR